MRGLFWVFALVGCSRGDDVTIDVTHDVCAPITLASASMTDGQATGIDDAIALWQARGVGTLERVADAATIEVRFESAAEAFHGVYDDENGIIYINTAITDPRPLAIVIAHELGHAFGLDHIAGRPSLMNAGNTLVLPTAEDDAAVQALWGPCALP